MRLLVILIVLALNAIAANAQALTEWHRVYTFDESTLELNTSVVTPISKDVNRVRFRWTFKTPQSLGKLRYQSELEVIELNCEAKTFRTYHLTFLDAAGQIVSINDSPGEWQHISHGYMSERLFNSGCELIAKKFHPAPPRPDDEGREKVAHFAYDFAQELERAKDFKPLINRFFVANYLSGYLDDSQTNWFMNLDREIARRVSRAELQRFYVAQMNAGYLTSQYIISQLTTEPEDAAAARKLLPNDVLALVRNHSYTRHYQRSQGDYDFLGEKIDSVERLRSYTDLLERISSLMRTHVRSVRASHSQQWRDLTEEWELYHPIQTVCDTGCRGLPAGTKLFAVNVPVFRLEVAAIAGNLKVVSAVSRF